MVTTVVSQYMDKRERLEDYERRALRGGGEERLARQHAAGEAELIKQMRKIQGQSTSNPCSISQAAAVAALHRLSPRNRLASQ